MGAFFVLNMTFLIIWVLVALFQGVLALGPMHRAWLERLLTAIAGNLVVLFLAVVVATIVVAAILPLEVVMPILLRPFVVTAATFVTLFRHPSDLLIVPLT